MIGEIDMLREVRVFSRKSLFENLLDCRQLLADSNNAPDPQDSIIFILGTQVFL
jgi:hypothetical protein